MKISILEMKISILEKMRNSCGNNPTTSFYTFLIFCASLSFLSHGYVQEVSQASVEEYKPEDSHCDTACGQHLLDLLLEKG